MTLNCCGDVGDVCRGDGHQLASWSCCSGVVVVECATGRRLHRSAGVGCAVHWGTGFVEIGVPVQRVAHVAVARINVASQCLLAAKLVFLRLAMCGRCACVRGACVRDEA